MNRIATLMIVLLASTAATAAERATAASAGSGVFDVYFMGIRVAELTVEDRVGSKMYTISKRDFFDRDWSDAVAAPEHQLAENGAFELWGSIARLPARMAGLRTVDWASLDAVGWPDRQTIYDRHRRLSAEVDGRPFSAWYWAQRDATRPMDLIFDEDNRLIAGIDVSLDIVMVRRGFEAFTTIAQWRAPSVSQPDFGVHALDKVMVEMSDGIRLATLVYLPKGDIEGPFPTILIRTPYGITDFIDRYWHHVARGYAVVLQAARGTSYWDQPNRSDGVWEPMINEPADGAATLDWITRQPWSDGTICMQGASYYGYTQWAAAMAGNPALKCLVPEVSMGTAFGDQPYMGGGFVEGLAYYMFWMLDHPAIAGRSWTEILHHRPLSDIDVYATGHDIPAWNNILDHWSNDEYWRRQDWYNSDTYSNLATFQISGWFDDDFPGTERNWELAQRKSIETQHLIVGPWKHGYNFDRMLNGFSFGADALRDDLWLRKQRWYDHFLKGVDNGIGERRVEYFVLGSNEWRTAGRWPPAEVEFTPWYFHSDGQANRLTTRGRLDTAPPTEAEPPDTYRYDPLYPVPNWTNFDRMERWADIQSFPYDFKDIEGRPDVVTFTSDVLAEDVTIAGETMLVLYASTDVPDTDWWGHVSDVQPDGSSVRLTTGMLRARFRNLEDPRYQIFGSNFVEQELLSGDPDDVVRYEIRIPAVANTFAKGHRIRISVMNALDNYNFPNSNTGGDEAHVTDTVVGTMTIHHSPQHPSHVLLPILPEE